MANNPSPDPFLPFQSHFVDVAGLRMHYVDEGQGPVVLFLHGNPTWCFFYRELICVLRQSFRCIAPDHLGCGLSDHPQGVHFRAVDRVAHFEEFIEKLGLKRFSLVMHDWGGPIGTGLAVQHVSSLERLVYLNTTLTETESLPYIIKRAASPLVGKLLTKYSMRFLKLMTDFGACRRLPKEVREAYHHPYRSVGRRTAIWDFVADIPFTSSHPTYNDMLDIATKLPGLSHIPVLLVWGLKDPCFHRGFLTKVAKHFPQAEIIEIPHASHLVLEDAGETAVPAIAAFLAGKPASTCQQNEQKQNTASSNACDARRQNALYSSFSRVVNSGLKNDAVIVPEFCGSSVRYLHVNYRDLDALVNTYQRGLAELGLCAADRVLMLVNPGTDFLALSYAVMGRGAIPMFVDPGMGRDNLFRCIRDSAPHVLIGTPRAQLLRLKKDLFPNLRFHVTASDWLTTGGPNLSYLKRFSSRKVESVEASGTCLVAYTSGATGVPKGVLFTNEMVEAQLAIFLDEFAVTPGKKDLPLLPIFSLYSVALGVCSVFPPMNSAKPLELDPQRMVKIISDLDISYSFGSPTLWNKIAEYCVRAKTQLPSLEKIFMAGAPVSEDTLRRVQGVLPHGAAYTPYGATEALPVTLVSACDILEHSATRAIGGELGTYVGRAVQGVEVRIAPCVKGSSPRVCELTTAPLQMGEIVVRGRNISPAYLNRDDATRAAKIQEGSSFWHCMGDMGYLDEAGNLYFCGRKSHLIESEDRVYYSIPTERFFNAHEKVKRSALIPIAEGTGVGIVIEPKPQFWPRSPEEEERFRSELREVARRSPLTEKIETFYFHPSFPVDARHNAKIFRDKLADWAARLERRRGTT